MIGSTCQKTKQILEKTKQSKTKKTNKHNNTEKQMTELRKHCVLVNVKQCVNQLKLINGY